MINLSERAWKMLNQKPRDLEGQPQTIYEIESLLKSEHYPLTHPIVSFQQNLGGYEMEVIFGHLLFGTKNSPAKFRKESPWFWEFAYSIDDISILSDRLVMSETGAIYCTGNKLPLASSVEVYIESNALREDLSKFPRPHFSKGGEGELEVNLEDIQLLGQRLIGQGFLEIKEASDGFEQWWLSSTSHIHAFRQWFSELSTVVVVADTLEQLEELGKVFKGIVNFPSNYYSWL